MTDKVDRAWAVCKHNDDINEANEPSSKMNQFESLIFVMITTFRRIFAICLTYNQAFGAETRKNTIDICLYNGFRQPVSLLCRRNLISQLVTAHDFFLRCT